MKSGDLTIIEIVLYIDSLSSKNLQNTTFYTIRLIIGSKQIWLQQKKSLSQPNRIYFSESLCLKLSAADLQMANNNAQLSIYSIQNYGKKKIFGNLTFIVEQTNHRQVKLKLDGCDDRQAEIKFNYGVYKCQSRISSQSKSIRSDNSNKTNSIKQYKQRFVFGQQEINSIQVKKQRLDSTQTKKQLFNSVQTKQHRSNIRQTYMQYFEPTQINRISRSINLNKEENLSNETLIKKDRLYLRQMKKDKVNAGQIAYKEQFDINNERFIIDEPISKKIQSNQLKNARLASSQIMQQLNLSDIRKEQLNQINSIRPQQTIIGSTGPLQASKVLQDKNNKQINLKQSYKKMHLSQKNACSEIKQNMDLVQSFQTALANIKNNISKDALQDQLTKAKGSEHKSKIFDKMYAVSTELNKVHQKQLQLQNQSHIYELISKEKHTLKPKPYQQPRQERESCNIVKKQYLKAHTQLQIASNTVSIYYSNQTKVCKDVVKNKTLLFIRPKTNYTDIQQWENDDNLKNIVSQTINSAKGNLGFIKLAKLTQLRKKIDQKKNMNRKLLHTNETLLENQKFLRKQLQLSEQIIKEKEKILTRQFQALRQQFKQVTKKLLDKYNEQINRENRLNMVDKQLQKYQKQIKQLTQKIQHKDKYIQHLRRMLILEDQNPVINQKQIIKPQQQKPCVDKQQKMLISRFNGIFKNSRQNSKIANNGRQQQIRHIKTELSIKQRQNNEQCKGINPDFIQFFRTFVDTKKGQKPRFESKKSIGLYNRFKSSNSSSNNNIQHKSNVQSQQQKSQKDFQIQGFLTQI